MADYFYPKVSGSYRHNLTQKCVYAIGRGPRAMMDTSGDKTMLRFDPPLTETEETLVADIMADRETACDAPKAGTKFIISDIFDSDFRENLGEQLGCTVSVWFTKSKTDLARPDVIEVHFSRELSVHDKLKVNDAVKDLMVGWL